MSDSRTPQPLTDEQLAEARERLTEARRVAAVGDWPLAEYQAVQRQQSDAAALLAEVDRLKAELVAEQSAHQFTLRQRDNRSNWILQLRDLADAAASGYATAVAALIEAARDTLAASRNDHKPSATQEAAR